MLIVRFKNLQSLYDFLLLVSIISYNGLFMCDRKLQVLSLIVFFTSKNWIEWIFIE